MTSLNLIDNVADAITRLRYLEKKNADDQQMLTLVTRQKDELAQELADAKHNFNVDMFQMQQERDAALKQAREVGLIIEAVGNMALSGVRKMKGDEVQTVKHLQAAPPPMKPVDDPRLPLNRHA